MFYMGSKYASAYTYIQVSLIEIVYAMNIFSVKYIFYAKKEWNKFSKSESKI